MHITRDARGRGLQLTVVGRLDSYWADHLDAALAEAVRDGHHHIRVDLAQVRFLSSAGIAALMRHYKQLNRISGSLGVVNPSAPVRVVLDMARVSALIIVPDDAGTPVEETTRAGGLKYRSGATFEVRHLTDAAGLRWRAVGTDAPLASAAFGDEHCSSLGSTSPVFAIGVGAFGSGFEDCRTRFGELLSVTGATGYQPGDGSNVADYLLSSGDLPDDIRVLYCLACEGAFTRLVRFDTEPPTAISLAALADACLETTDAPAAGFVLIAEAAGLVGAALRWSPTERVDDFFAHPAVQRRLTFTSARAFGRSLTLAAGVVVRPGAEADIPQLRPLGTAGLLAHVHAAAFPYRPLKKGRIDLRETVTSLFEHEGLLGVLHLLSDDRGGAGAGDSEFIRGACWVGAVTAAGPAPQAG